jgi:hypothetical protein
MNSFSTSSSNSGVTSRCLFAGLDDGFCRSEEVAATFALAELAVSQGILRGMFASGECDEAAESPVSLPNAGESE